MSTKSVLLAITMVISFTSAIELNDKKPLVKKDGDDDDPYSRYNYNKDMYDPEFWEGFDEEEEPYEHDWAHIPDFINCTNVDWYFGAVHHFLTGIERGIYMNDSIVLHKDCFGPRYVNKTNMLAAMVKDNLLHNIMPAAAVTY